MSPAATLKTAATCACGHQQDRHYRERSVCSSLSCACSTFRERAEEDLAEPRP